MPKYLADCPLYEADLDRLIPPRGSVYRRKGVDDGHTPGTMIDIYYIDAPIDTSAARQFLEAQRGKPYDFRGIMGFVTRRNSAHPDRWFCSELVFAAARAGGVDLLDRVEPRKVTPGMLEYSPHLRYLGRTWARPLPVFVHSIARGSRMPYIESQPSDDPTHAKTPDANLQRLAISQTPYLEPQTKQHGDNDANL
jgi:hypothetical protein